MKLIMPENKLSFRFVHSVLPPVLFGALIIILGETRILHALLSVTEVQLPKTSSILRVIFENGPKIVHDSWVTLQVFLAGIVIGCFAGFLVALFAAFFPKWGVGGLTVISAFNAIPIVALSPIMRLWFSNSPFAAKTAVVAIVSMVAMSVNAYRGLTDLKPFSLDLMESYAASKAVIFFKLRLPNCVPYIFIALKINVAAAMIGVIISEYFAASVEGLGFVIRNSLRTTQLTTGWAYILVASIIGILFFTLISFLEKKLMRNR
ncbi:ABC transporter, permease protein [Treponema primitia ZAS-2]|uniref:ABC transporter, permease protein n=1 Tax=Treponema primitia (strain ATCC BAA-887 / DSM 12427 / ZAS-2) TaxID=545694 RepID=F5YM76_TREPZ|nr:ABC transporter permease subunit [Treponema primitia]AEF84268.1 ABC transporter, permease protein [Treponema primitia ZAS-2]